MKSFDYSCPDTFVEIIERASEDDEASFLAGGMTLLPTLKQRLANPSQLVDLAGVPFLADIEFDVDDDVLVIGAMATHDAINRSGLVKEHLPALAELAGLIGDVQVRNRGTIGGSLANNDPAADYPAAVLACGAIIETDQREISADDFFVGMFETALRPGELIVNVRFPTGISGKYAKFPHPISGYAMAGVFVTQSAKGVQVAVTGAGPCVFRWREIETILTQSFNLQAIEDIAIDPDRLASDVHADSTYRAQLVKVMAKRAVAALIS